MRSAYMAVIASIAAVALVTTVGLLPSAAAVAGFAGLGLMLSGGSSRNRSIAFWAVPAGVLVLIVAVLALISLSSE